MAGVCRLEVEEREELASMRAEERRAGQHETRRGVEVSQEEAHNDSHRTIVSDQLSRIKFSGTITLAEKGCSLTSYLTLFPNALSSFSIIHNPHSLPPALSCSILLYNS